MCLCTRLSVDATDAQINRGFAAASLVCMIDMEDIIYAETRPELWRSRRARTFRASSSSGPFRFRLCAS
jgi:hypothetical protein